MTHRRLQAINAWLVPLMIFWVMACGPTDAELTDTSKSPQELESEAESMTREELERRLDRIGELLKEKERELEGIVDQVKEIEIGDLLGDEIKRLNQAKDDLRRDLEELAERLKIYTEQITQRPK